MNGAGDAAPPIETEVLIVGAGPAGLFHAFELGLLEIGAHIVDSLPQAGGQCAELYRDKPIYDIPGTPVCSGGELVERLLLQVEPFAPPLHLGQRVQRVDVLSTGGFAVATSAGMSFVAGAVVIAGGVGAFEPRRLKIAGLEAHAGVQVFEDLAGAVGSAGARGRFVIAGGGAAAVATAIELAAAPLAAGSSVTLLHRRDDFDAEPTLLTALRTLREQGRVRVVVGQPEGVAEAAGRLAGLQLLGADGSTQTLPLDTLMVRLGWSPKLGPIAEWGLALEKKQLVVDSARFETSQPGVFAIGDVNTYPGKKKLIVSGFHEATLAAFAIAERLHPERAQPLQYTTTSPRLHALLGVAQRSEPPLR